MSSTSSPAYEDDRAVRIELFGDEIERLSLFDPLRGKTLEELPKATGLSRPPTM